MADGMNSEPPNSANAIGLRGTTGRLETVQKPALGLSSTCLNCGGGEVSTAPPNVRPVAVATGRSEGDIVVVGEGGDSVESEGQTALLGDSGVVR